MKETEIPAPGQQLRPAVESVTRPPLGDGDVFQIEVPRAAPLSAEGSQGLGPEVGRFAVQLVGRQIQDDDGAASLVWAYEGPLRVTDADVAWIGGEAKLEGWLQAELGPRCHRVHVRSRDKAAGSAEVTAEFRVEATPEFPVQ